MSLENLLQKAKSYELTQEVIDEKETGRLEFMEKFPLSRIKNLTIDEYVPGIEEKDGFCYWLEFKKILFGIGGGNASKFGLYKSKKDGNYYGGTGQNKILLKGKKLENEFQIIKDVIVKALELTKKDRISEIKNLDVPFWNMVLQKILAIYYPDKFLMIGASQVLIKVAEDIGLDNVDLSPNNLIEINYECKKLLDEQKETKDWDYEKLSRLVWTNYQIEESGESSLNSKKYWLYSPGEDAEHWEEFYSGGIMGLGWDKLGDLDKYEDKDSIVKKLQEIDNTTSSKKNDAAANYEFKNEINIGDVIIVKKGRGALLGAGIVVSDYFYDKNRTYFQKCRKVDWKTKGEWEVDHSLALKTLTDITQYPTEDTKYYKYYERLLSFMPGFDDVDINYTGQNMGNGTKVISLNTILYGPPGTGKTYHTINQAVEICDSSFFKTNSENRIKIKQRLTELLKTHQVEFITFHQSMSYEDFIEGIKPLKPEKDQPLKYDIEEGLFKRIANRALSNYESTLNENSKLLPFEEAFDKLKEEWDDKNDLQLPLKTSGHEFTLLGFTNTSIQFKKASGGTGHTLSVNTLKELYYGKAYDFKSGLGIYYNSLLNKIKSYQSETNVNTYKNYVIIIDEINRGNVSSIFGELITLIEDDKRRGKGEALEITLPYSKESFAVPPNLFIVGTMNTADRSVEALDTALRRRFSFIEIMPDYSLIKSIDGINLANVLKTINSRLCYLINEDHQIGHSYFMNISSLDELKIIFKNKIIPLLKEYFYNDSSKIQLVLGDGFVKKENKTKPIFAVKTDDVIDKDIYNLLTIDKNFNIKEAINSIGEA